ncbi:MAG TPA: M48 family metalloprotease [Terriglobales bacterium]|nr:M48 family metalloprotease [Terriglobales bacterium]
MLGHEIGHVALRHGTNQASKDQIAQAPLAILGGLLGSGSVGSVLAQVGAGSAVNSVLLKYSRDAGRQADIIGMHILYDGGYDPRAMSHLFEKLQAEGKKGRPAECFSRHPNPENRAKRVTEEIAKLGGVSSIAVADSHLAHRRALAVQPVGVRLQARRQTGDLNIRDERHPTASANFSFDALEEDFVGSETLGFFERGDLGPLGAEPVMAHRKPHNPGVFDGISAKDRVPMQPRITARIHPQFLLHSLSLIGVFKFNRVQSEVNEPVDFDEFDAESVVHSECACELFGNVAVFCSLHPEVDFI